MSKQKAVQQDRGPGRALSAPLAELLHDIATGTAAASDADFFPSVVRYLMRTLRLAYAFVGEVTDPSERQVRTLAFGADGAIKPNFQYDIDGTPCESVVGRGVQVYPSAVQQTFPRDKDLVTFAIEAYAGAPLYDSKGKCLGLLVVMDRMPFDQPDEVRNVLHLAAVLVAAELERRNTTRELETNQRTLATLLSNLPGMVYRCRNDERWTMEFVSEGALSLTGYTADAFVQQRVNYGELIHPDDRQKVWDDVQSALAHREPFRLVYRICTAGGDEKWVWEQGCGMFDADGALLHLEGFITDITERKQAEEALRASEERFKSLTELSSDWYWEQDAELRFTLITRSSDIAWRFPIEQSLGHRRWELPYVDVLEAEWERHRAVLEARLPFHDLVLKRRDTNGRVRYSCISGVPFFDRSGTFLGYRGIGRDITERKQAEDARRAAEENLRTVLGSAPITLWATDRDGVVTLCEGQAFVFGHEARAVIGRSLYELVPDNELLEATRRALAGTALMTTVRAGERAYEVHYRPRFESGVVTGLIGVAFDISARHAAEDEMRKLSSAVQQTADCVLITNRDGVIEYVNQAFEGITGYSRSEAIGAKPNLVKSGLQTGEFYHRLWTTILAGGTFCEVFINRKKDGGLYYEEKTITPLKDAAGRITHFISTGKDITERMQVQERLHYLAHHDALTGLPNRMLFLDRLNQALIRAHWHQRSVGVLFLDLDRFKTINDTLGHDTGDRFLQAIAGRLGECLRERDTVARFGGDEFAIILEDLAHTQDAAPLASKILEAFARPLELAGREYYVTTSIGISLYPTDGTDAATLLKHADAAMYQAKELGKNTYQFYSADMGAHAFERLTLETSLRHALDRREFVLHYQPQVSLADGRIVGIEALLRWQHPQLGLLAPAQFISVAEETGMIVPIGDWVARAACEQAKRWEEAGLPPVRIAINVSARQFNEPGFVDGVARLLAETRFDPNRLEFEITESVIMKNAQVTIARLHALHAMGVRFAVDDFGTGYSSLSYLRRFAVHTLKIDKSFIHDVTVDQGDAEIVKTIIAMARGLHLAVVAEGVETKEQLAFLRSQGCEAVQGYLFSRPLPADHIPRLLTGSRLIG